MIDFEWYRSFISIYKQGSVSAAAKTRFLTQPAMSQHLAALESEVGEPLFLRAPRKMIPTDKGKEMYTKLVPLIEHLETATQEIQHYAKTDSRSPLLKIGSPVEYFTGRVSEKIKGTDTRLITSFGVASTLLDELIKEEVDLIFTPKKQTVPGIEYKELEVETFVIVAPPGFKEQHSSLAEIEEWVEEQAWLSYGLDLPIIRRFWREHFKRRPTIQARHIIPNLYSILKGVENGLGLSILPSYLIEESVAEGKSTVLYGELSVDNTLYAAYRMDKKGDPIIQSLLNQW
ncbi:LysR family transcriptional regulator [Bacillus sp. SB49]|uniref:LysR family transcriptional regulator n=1 Tax=Bacillus sp. SB49 TaxID=1071080 RepID=UPI0003FA5D49|nr:LysR family transcriptional regulator [Bacillus sp. SB49]QHT47872.1 LysR family transcriptional regulator [Bacillus sp. SB49]